MNYDHFVGQVQHRARLGSLGDAVGAIRGTLETLGERLSGGEAKDLAAQLPREIGYYLFRGAIPFGGERFHYREFVERVANRERVDPPLAAYHSRVVMEVVGEAVSGGEIDDVADQLPADFAPLFAGSSGSIRRLGPRSENRWILEGESESSGRRAARSRPEQEARIRARSQRQYTGG
jgi:uncharacterized protein (DUF2267 family)